MHDLDVGMTNVPLSVYTLVCSRHIQAKDADDEVPADILAWSPDLTQQRDSSYEQEQALQLVQTACLSFKAVSVRGMHLRTESVDSKLKTQDCAVAAAFHTRTHTQIVRYGKIQEILQVNMSESQPQLFLKVNWYKPSIVGPCSSIHGRTRIKCNGLASSDKHSKEPIIRADKVDSQVFFSAIPAHLTHHQKPWVWVCQDVSSSYTLPQHLLDDDHGDDDVVPRD